MLLVVLLADFPDIDEGDVVTQVRTGLGPLTDRGFPRPEGIAALAAALTASAPWLSRRWRRWGWVAVVGLVLTRFLTVADVVRLLRGGAGRVGRRGGRARRPRRTVAPTDGRRHPRGPRARRAAAAEPRRRRASTPAAPRPYFGVGADGTRYFVKALGDDQRSADLLFRLYRSIQRHDLGDERPFSSLRRAVEHEAFVALAARDLGIRTPRMRAIAYAEPNAFVLAYEAVDGQSLDGVPPEEITDDVLADVWQQLGRLRDLRIAHRDLRLANIFLASDGEVWMIDFGFSEIAASDLLLANDVAELVASSSAVVGAERATAHAIAIGRSRHPGRRARATAAVGAERRLAHGAEGATRSARRPAGPTRSGVNTAGLATRGVRRRGPRRARSPLARGPVDPGLGAAAVPRRQRLARLALRAPLAGDAARQPGRRHGRRARRRLARRRGVRGRRRCCSPPA